MYEYEDVNTGRRVECIMKVEERDNMPAPWRRITVPKRVAVVFGLQAETSVDVATPKAFRDLEQTMNYKQIEKESGFSVDHIKRTFDFK